MGRSCAPSTARRSGAPRRRRAFRARCSSTRTAVRAPNECERLGQVVRVVRGSERALKVTDAEDFARVEALYAVDE